MRKKSFLVLLIALIPLLAGCVRLEGEISIDGGGLVNGQITYALDKSLASQAGINTLDDLKKNAQKENENKVCSSESYSESASELIFNCAFKGAALSDNDLKVQKIGSQVVFTFNQSGGDSTLDLGRTSLVVNFPGNITLIKESKPGITIKKSDTSAIISASGTATFQVSISSNINNLTNSTTNANSADSLTNANQRLTNQNAMWLKLNKYQKELLSSKSAPSNCRLIMNFPPPKVDPIETYTSRADSYEKNITPCLNAIDQVVGAQSAPTPTPTPTQVQVPVGRTPEKIQALFAEAKMSSNQYFSELQMMRANCPIMVKYSNGMVPPQEPKFTGVLVTDNNLLTKFQNDVNNFVTVIVAKLRPVYAGPECTKKANTKTNSAEEEVIAGEEIADYEITAKYLGTSGTRISIVASPNATVNILASKKGVKKKISFKVTTDGNGEKSFRTPSNLKGYDLQLIEAGEEVAVTSVK